jgi:CheY-like chemotaxis protein
MGKMIDRRIMVVDDEKEIRELFRDVLESRGYKVVTCDDGEVALDEITKHDIFAAFVDIRMPGIDGVETLRQMRILRPNTHVVVITGYTRSEDVDEALKLGCFVCMMKPFKLRDITGILEILEAGEEELPYAA